MKLAGYWVVNFGRGDEGGSVELTKATDRRVTLVSRSGSVLDLSIFKLGKLERLFGWSGFGGDQRLDVE